MIEIGNKYEAMIRKIQLLIVTHEEQRKTIKDDSIVIRHAAALLVIRDIEKILDETP
jgi:hypothetical protein